MIPWNNWYHCNGNTYGTWLRGDPRGFRERHHRSHIEGDYRNPPQKGLHDAKLRMSHSKMKLSAVYLSRDEYEIAGLGMVQNLQRHDVVVLALCLDDHHFHLLARFPDRRPRWWIGRAKLHSSRLLVDRGRASPIWAKRCRCLPITDRGHQVNTFQYISQHADRGAYVWTFRDALPSPNG